MSYAYSTNPQVLPIIEYRRAELPPKVWIQDTVDAGHFEYPTPETANNYNFWLIDDSAVKPVDTALTTWESTYTFVTDTFVRSWVERSKTSAELNAEDRAVKRNQLGQSISTLRSWADDAEATTVDSGNAVATLQVVVNRLGIFFDRFADLIEVQRLDQ